MASPAKRVAPKRPASELPPARPAKRVERQARLRVDALAGALAAERRLLEHQRELERAAVASYLLELANRVGTEEGSLRNAFLECAVVVFDGEQDADRLEETEGTLKGITREIAAARRITGGP